VTISRMSDSKLLRDYFTWEQTDCELRMQSLCLKRKLIMVAGAQRDTREIVGRYLNMIRIQLQQTSSTRCRVPLSCPSKIAANKVGVPHRGVGGCRAWPKNLNGESSLTCYIIYTKRQDKTTPARVVGNRTCERPTAASEDSLGPNLHHAFMSQARTKSFEIKTFSL